MMDGPLGQIIGQSDIIFRGTAGFAATLAKIIAGGEIVWFTYQTLINKKSIEEVLHGFAQKILGLVLMVTVIYWISNTGGQVIVNTITQDFMHAGQSVSQQVGGGMLGSSPDSIVTQGLEKAFGLLAANVAVPIATLATTIFTTGAATGATVTVACGTPYTGAGCAVGPEIAFQGELGMAALESAIFGMLIMVAITACVGVIFGFVRLAVELFLTMVETYVFLGAATLLLGFSTSRWTQDIAAPFKRYAMMLAFRTFALYVIGGICVGLLNSLSDINPVNLVLSAVFPAAALVAMVKGILNIFVVAAIVNALLKAPGAMASALLGMPQGSAAGGDAAMQAFGKIAGTAVAAASGAHAGAMGAMGGGGSTSSSGSHAGAHPTGGSSDGGHAVSDPPHPPGAAGGGFGGAGAVSSPPQSGGMSRLANVAQASFQGAVAAGMQHAFGISGGGDDASSSSSTSSSRPGGNGGQQIASAVQSAFSNPYGSAGNGSGGGGGGGGSVGQQAANAVQRAFTDPYGSDSGSDGSGSDSDSNPPMYLDSRGNVTQFPSTVSTPLPPRPQS